MKTWQKSLLLCVCGVALIALYGVFNTTKSENNVATHSKNRMEAEGDFLTLQQMIEKSDCAIQGEYVSVEENELSVEYIFKVTGVLYGSISEEYIHVLCHKANITITDINYEYIADKPIYTVGEEYILLLDCFDSLFNEYPQYLLVSDSFFPVEQPESQRIYNILLTDLIQSNMSLAEYIKSYRASIPAMLVPQDKTIRYTKSDDINDILQVTDYIIKARVDTLMAEGVDSPCLTYYCLPIELIQGDKIIKNEQGKIGIIVPLDSVEVGEICYFLVNHVDDMSILYKVSSYNSILTESEFKLFFK